MTIFRKWELTWLLMIQVLPLSFCASYPPRQRYQRLSPGSGGSRLVPGHVIIPNTADRIVQDAVKAVAGENRILEHRKVTGIDKVAADFVSLSPAILGGVRETRGTSTLDLASSCRVINWVTEIARSRGVNRPLSAFMNTPAGFRNRLTCPFVAPGCDPNAPYRSANGTCNNLRNPLWGSSFIPFTRDLQAVYGSGRVGEIVRHDLPRQTGHNNAPLPSPRVVSNYVHATSAMSRDTSVTMLLTNFGQALSHDLTDTPMEGGADNARLDCCHVRNPTQRCAPIRIPPTDFFSKYRRTCINFFRSLEVTDINCETGQREQLNVATSLIDATHVYGRDSVEMAAVRDEEGRLKTSFGNQFPFQQHPNTKAFEMGLNLLKSGDEKLSESPGLLAATAIFYREHNRIAKRLATLPNFAQLPKYARDDRIFEEARKLVIALFQQVVYKEYLPVVVGPAAMVKYNLTLASGYFTGYNPNVNPTVSNSFATATMRFGHSMVRDSISVLGKNYSETSNNLQMKDVFWRTNFFLMHESGIQRGHSTDASEVCDRHLSLDLRNHLFQTKKGNGLDLASLNIQRGRDHGLPSYADFRKSVGLTVPQEWSTHPERGFRDMEPDTVEMFRKVYQSPADVDLWSGGVSEKLVPGGQVGPLFANLLGQQFNKLRIGDRFWYENEDKGFRADQLLEIRKVGLAKILCNNVEGLETIQENAFIVPTTGGNNDRVACSSLPDMDLGLWA